MKTGQPAFPLQTEENVGEIGAGYKSAMAIVAEIEANLATKSKRFQHPTIRSSGRATR